MNKRLKSGLKESEFELQSRYYAHFRTNNPAKYFEPTDPKSYGLNSIIAILKQVLVWH